MNGQTQVKFTLGIGLAEAEQEDVFDLEEVLPDWENLTKEEIDEKLYLAWKTWIWDYIDGAPEILKDEEEDDEDEDE